MPNSTLPGNTYLGNGQRTTAEIQAGLDQVATWLNAAQAELNALTGTTFGEAAVRGVGTGATDLVQTSQLNTRIGTETNLSGLEGFDPRDPELVWSGNSATVDYSEIDGGDLSGIYVFEFSPPETSDTFRGSVYRKSGQLQSQVIYSVYFNIVGFPDSVLTYVEFGETSVRLLSAVEDGNYTTSSQNTINIWRA